MVHCLTPTISLSERRAYTMGEAAALLGMSVSTLYAERARGRLRTSKLAGRRLVTREQLDTYIAAANRDPLPPALTSEKLPHQRGRPSNVRGREGLAGRAAS
jgi:excisionase family DNA binding protein